ncbi:unnamed protein product [Ixodes pacificus]
MLFTQPLWPSTVFTLLQWLFVLSTPMPTTLLSAMPSLRHSKWLINYCFCIILILSRDNREIQRNAPLI